jgi:hypothetical protein
VGADLPNLDPRASSLFPCGLSRSPPQPPKRQPVAKPLKGFPDGASLQQAYVSSVATETFALLINGFPGLSAAGIAFDTVYDQGPSFKRLVNTNPNTVYNRYVRSLFGEDAVEPAVRKTAAPGLRWDLGGQVSIRVLSAMGDTYGDAHDVDLYEKRAGIALLIRLGQFELYTAGDQTSDDWCHVPGRRDGRGEFDRVRQQPGRGRVQGQPPRLREQQRPAVPARARPRGRDTLERHVVQLEALLEKFRSDDLRADGASLEDDLEMAREVCDMVEALIEAGESRR